MAESPLPAELAGIEPPFPLEHLDRPEWEPWVPINTGQAEWAMRKLGEEQAAAWEISNRAAGWRAQIDGWEHHELGPIMQRAARMEQALKAFGLQYRGDTGKPTFSTPAGSISTRVNHAAPKVEVDDEEALIGWIELLDGDQWLARVVEVTKTLRVDVLRENVTVHEADDGTLTVTIGDVVVPHVHAERGRVTATVRPGR